jgi:hypothetical protein
MILSFILYLSAAGMEFPRFLSFIENKIDFERCTMANPGSEHIFCSGNPVVGESEITLYAPKSWWNTNRFVWELDQNAMKQYPYILIVTNGYTGKDKFFSTLEGSESLQNWNVFKTTAPEMKEFMVFSHINQKDFVGFGPYQNLGIQPVGTKFSVCGRGAPYVVKKKRESQDREFSAQPQGFMAAFGEDINYAEQKMSADKTT